MGVVEEAGVVVVLAAAEVVVVLAAAEVDVEGEVEEEEVCHM